MHNTQRTSKVQILQTTLFLFSNLELLSSTNTAIKHFERSMETQNLIKIKEYLLCQLIVLQVFEGLLLMRHLQSNKVMSEQPTG